MTLMPSTTYLPGRDITRSTADCLVNTVNCVGVMGKGVALAFKNAFPAIMAPYQSACRRGAIRPGTTKLLPLHLTDGRPAFWAAMATKNHWRDPSQLAWIEPALVELAAAARAAGVRSIAIPPPGCGNGGLDWRVVEPIVLRVLADFDLEIYAAPSHSTSGAR